MSEIEYKNIQLNKLFKYVSGNINFNKSYCHEHSGEFPVFTATIEKPLGCISTYEYEGKYLSWTVDGVNSGTVEILEGKFSTGNGRGLLIPILEGINIDYVKFVLEPLCKREASGRGRGGTPHCKWSHIQKQTIKMPVHEDGSLNEEFQSELADKYLNILEQKKILISKLDELKTINVLLPESADTSWSHAFLKDIFKDISRGNSKYTKTFCKENSGDYPVYSADNEKPLGMMNTYDYDGEYLTISINGLAGKITIFNGKFSTNADRVVCIPNDNIDIRYIMHVAEPILRNKNKGRKGDLGKNEFTKLTPDMIKNTKIPIPITADGIFDLAKQTELSAKYDQINRIKMDISVKISELTSIVIS